MVKVVAGDITVVLINPRVVTLHHLTVPVGSRLLALGVVVALGLVHQTILKMEATVVQGLPVVA